MMGEALRLARELLVELRRLREELERARLHNG
jgi:hypothetical protein